ncbi:hypothetical protein BC835DRAFT_1372740 [Cytidiella melzeri]|nr:hypothetical protein BC835DRAFT_1372740 [Cytidiella melzeri]
MLSNFVIVTLIGSLVLFKLNSLLMPPSLYRSSLGVRVYVEDERMTWRYWHTYNPKGIWLVEVSGIELVLGVCFCFAQDNINAANTC